MTFDEKVKSLRGKVLPKSANKKKSGCTPEEWAARLDYEAVMRAASPEKYKHASKKWESSHRDKSKERKLRWNKRNTESVRQQKQRWKKRARQDNADFRVRENLRTRLWYAIKGNAKAGSAVRDMGCTIDQFWEHMEPQFQPGMTRENMGTAWEIDHIFPLVKADLGDRVEFLAANNWRNLQPLTPTQNREKGDTVTLESQALFDRLKSAIAKAEGGSE
jgi:hypothetical protein